MGTEVTIERYAEVRADMETGVLYDEALARAGLTSEEWDAAQRAWLERMGAEVARGRFELVNRYTNAVLERQRARTALAAQSERGTSKVETWAVEGLEVPAVRPEEAKPSYLLAGAAEAQVAPPVKRAPAALSGTTMNLVIPKGPALPFAASRPAPPVQQAAAPAAPSVVAAAEAPVATQVKRAPAALSGTSMDLVIPKGAALPFAPSPPSTLPQPAPPPNAAPAPVASAPPAVAPAASAGASAPTMPKVQRANPLLSGTMAVDVSAFTLPGSALPFTTSPSEPRPAAKVADPVPAAPPMKRPPAALSGTSMGFAAPKGPALPFAPSGSPTTPQAEPAPAPPTQTPTPATDSSSAQGIAAPPLSLERYASLCVDLAADAAKTNETLQRYGLTMDQARAVDAYWKRRVAGEPGVREAFERAYTTYQKWLLGTRAGAPTP